MVLAGKLLTPRHMGRCLCHRFTTVCQTPSYSPALLTLRPHPINVPCATRVTVFQTNKKAGYEKSAMQENKLKMALDGVKMLKSEMKLFMHEWKVKVENDSVMDREHLDHTYLFHFKNEKEVKSWTVTCDSDHLEGSSTATLDLNRNGNALFYGNICTQVPKDGIIKETGYANIRSPRLMRSFKRAIPYDLSRYTHLVMRVRGDGRTYMINLQMDMTFDIHWDDVYNFPLYTRGGPYWQVAKIPFSRFYKGFKGRIQDKQEQLILDRIANFGITIGDDNDGPFQLEIDYLGCMYDMNHEEEFAWEMYQAEPYTVGV